MVDIWTRLKALQPVDPTIQAQSAVLMPLYDDGNGIVRVVLTKRPDSMRTHPGDVVFPGGGIEPGEGAVEAALREAWEEVALDPGSVEVIGSLNPVTTRDRSNWIVPIVGRIERPERFIPDPAEVEFVLEPTMGELLDEDRWRTSDWMGHQLWYYDFPQGTLWGATAFMLRELLGIVRDGAD